MQGNLHKHHLSSIMKLVVVLILLSLAVTTDALTCVECDQTCPSLVCDEFSFRPCGCCSECSLKVGDPCGSFTQSCEMALWCTKKSPGKIEAYRNPPLWLNFKGVCAQIDITSTP